jgi:hypothetical protein
MVTPDLKLLVGCSGNPTLKISFPSVRPCGARLEFSQMELFGFFGFFWILDFLRD